MDAGIIIGVLILGLIPFVVRALISSMLKNNIKTNEKNMKSDHVVVRFPKPILWVGLATVVLGIFCILSSLYNAEDDAHYIKLFFLFMCLPGMFCMYWQVRWKIDVYQNEDYFDLRPLFAGKRRIKYSECVYFQEIMDGYKVKTRHRTFEVGFFYRE